MGRERFKWFTFFVVMSFLAISAASTVSEGRVDEGHCTWYGKCPYCNEENYNYLYEGKAKLLEDGSFYSLQDLCPDFFVGLGNYFCYRVLSFLFRRVIVTYLNGFSFWFTDCTFCGSL